MDTDTASSQETKIELFQKTFPTEDYENLEPRVVKVMNGKNLFELDDCFYYIDRETSRQYCWESDNCVWREYFVKQT